MIKPDAPYCQIRLGAGSDSHLLADTAADFDSKPVVLDGVSIDWGRKNLLEQPETATARVTLLSKPDRPLPDIEPGTTLSILAQSQNLRENHNVATELSLQNVYEHDGPLDESYRFSHSLYVQNGNGLRSVSLAPYPLPESDMPNAWDFFPLNKGSNITLTFSIDIAQNCKIKFTPIYFTKPAAEGARLAPTSKTIKATTGTHTLTFPGFPKYAWLGMKIDLIPDTPSWSDTPGTWKQQQSAWGEYVAVVSFTHIKLNFQNYYRPITVFKGTISDIQVAPSADSLLIDISAVDSRPTLNTQNVGGDDWPSESVAKRLKRIDKHFEDLTIRYDKNLLALKDATLAGGEVAGSSALALIESAARSAGALAWVVSDIKYGDFVYIEDPCNRSHDPALTLDAGALPAPVTVFRNYSDVASFVNIGYCAAAEDRTDATSFLTGVNRKLYKKIGVRVAKFSTEVYGSVDALKARYLSLCGLTGWKFDNLTVDTRLLDLQPHDYAVLLSSFSRIGLPIKIENSPAWLPETSLMYLDGGNITFKKQNWILNLFLTPPYKELTHADYY